MNGAAYDTYNGFNFSWVYLVVPSELYTLERRDERAQAQI